MVTMRMMVLAMMVILKQQIRREWEEKQYEYDEKNDGYW